MVSVHSILVLYKTFKQTASIKVICVIIDNPTNSCENIYHNQVINNLLYLLYIQKISSYIEQVLRNFRQRVIFTADFEMHISPTLYKLSLI